jgi:sRNA-binding carbon storage regulator CsrA
MPSAVVWMTASRIGVTAPKQIAVDREEIAARKVQNPRNKVAHAIN